MEPIEPMENLCYNSLDLAAIITSLGLGCRATAEFLENIWAKEHPFIDNSYRNNKRQLISDTHYWLTYLSDKPTIDAEFPILQRDAQSIGTELPIDNYTADISDFGLYFKSVRLRILYGPGQDYVRIKRRTLMSKYGYRRITPALAEYFRNCTYFYHIQPYIRDYIPCKIEDTNIDEMIIFRIV